MHQPLSSTDHTKLVGFILLMLIAIASVGIGVLPALLLIYGIFMAKYQRDFTYIEGACKWSMVIIVVGALVGTFSLFVTFDSGRGRSFFILCILVYISAGIYILAIKKLFLAPLSEHKEWVIHNGIFSNKTKVTKPRAAASVNIPITKGVSQYSVADELLKWTKLKNDGVVSEEEFNAAKSQLLAGK